MPNDVRLKLSVDASDTHKEIRLIDKELSELGSDASVPKENGKKKSTSKGESEGSKQGSTDKSKQEVRDNVYKQILKEVTLIRKEIQNTGGNSRPLSGGGGTTPPTNTSTPTPLVPNSSTGGTDNSKLGTALGKLGTALGAITSVASVVKMLSGFQYQSQTSQSEAYRVYGSSLWYDDYGQARKDAANLGVNYGYNYTETMAAADANLSKTGYTTQENYETDMNSLLMTSKAWGLDTSSVANASGSMVAMGAFESGDQKKFADLLAESIVEAEMEGREDEQLQVLESIADQISENAASVSGDSLTGSLSMYTALVNQNEDLKGSRGASLVTNLNEMAASGNQSLLQLAGFGTEFTGLEGKQYLTQLAEENPEEFYKLIAQNIESGQFGFSGDSPYLKEILYSNGLSYSKADEVMSMLSELAQGTYDLSDTSEGEEATEERNRNWNDSTISNLEQGDAYIDETKAEVGDAASGVKSGVMGLWNNLSPGWKTVTGAGAIAGTSLLGTKGLSKGLNWVGNTFSGTKVGDAASVAGSTIDDILSKFKLGGTKVADAAAEAADDIVDAGVRAASGMDEAADAASAVGNVLSNTDEVADAASAGAKVLSGADEAADVLSGASKGASTLGKASKVLGVIGTVAEVVSTGIDTYGAIKDEDYREAASEVGGGVGSIAGGAGGAAAGAAAGGAIGALFGGIGAVPGAAIGGIIGGIGGGIGGDKLGEKAGEGIYDLATDDPVYTDDQRKQIQKYYDKVQELYDSEGNNAAQKYTNDVVTPYLNSIGVSKSITNAYKTDVGKPDFLKDYEKGKFGDSEDSEDSEGSITILDDGLSDNTKAVQENTEIMKDYLAGENLSKANETIMEDLQTDDSDEKSGNWFTNLFKSHAVGNDYVPYDNYLASLHKGEMVLNKFDAEDYRQGSGSSGSGGSSSLDLNINVGGSISGMTSENQSKIVEAIIARISSSNLQDMISNGFVRVQNI